MKVQQIVVWRRQDSGRIHPYACTFLSTCMDDHQGISDESDGQVL
jgi:hypothetical protein